MSVTVNLAHDYLTQRGGAERVALLLAKTFPESTLFTSIYSPELTYGDFRDISIVTSRLQSIPAFRRDPKMALPLLPGTWRQIDAGDCDVVLCSSTGWAHGIRSSENTKKIVYCHNPARWLYQRQEYVRSKIEMATLRLLGPRLKRWDRDMARTAHMYLANSEVVARRVRANYGISAEVVHPPVMVDLDSPLEEVDDVEPGYWLVVARGRKYKNVDAVITAVERFGLGQLVVVGAGAHPDDSRERSGRVRFMNSVSEAQLRWLYTNARALVSAAYEDFGLTPIEANAFGTPAVVLRAGGFLETVEADRNGVFFDRVDSTEIASKLRNLPDFNPLDVKAATERFSVANFQRRMLQTVESVV